MPDSLSLAQARRIALAAQGFGGPRPASVGTRQLNALFDRLRVLQIDSVNVFERNHYLPAFARLGAYDKALLDNLTFGSKPRYIEYWAHVAAFVPLDTWPLWKWRMRRYDTTWLRKSDSWLNTHRDLLAWLRAELAANGPLAASEIEHDANARRGSWWGWSDVKIALEHMFITGDVVAAGRKTFERRYALPEQVIPSHLVDAEVPQDDAIRQLASWAAAAHGVGTVRDLADYFRLPVAEAKQAIVELVDAGELLPVRVEGWKQQAYLHRDARIPRRIESAAVLSPFDPVVWFRDRSERLFDFHYRIEIYTPAPKRQFGYYTLAALVDDRIVGRIDLKSDRQRKVLRVQSAWLEAHATDAVAPRLIPVLRETAAWQGLEGIEVQAWGDLAPALAAELGVPLLPRTLADDPAPSPEPDAG